MKELYESLDQISQKQQEILKRNLDFYTECTSALNELNIKLEEVKAHVSEMINVQKSLRRLSLRQYIMSVM